MTCQRTINCLEFDFLVASQYIPLVMLWDSLESIVSCEHHWNILRSIISNNKSLLFVFLISDS